MRIGQSKQTVDVGEDAIFRCFVTGSKVDSVEVVWYKDGHPVIGSSLITMVASEDRNVWTLHLNNVVRSDAGMYQCLASNDDDNAQSTSRLIIGGKS